MVLGSLVQKLMQDRVQTWTLILNNMVKNLIIVMKLNKNKHLMIKDKHYKMKNLWYFVIELTSMQFILMTQIYRITPVRKVWIVKTKTKPIEEKSLMIRKSPPRQNCKDMLTNKRTFPRMVWFKPPFIISEELVKISITHRKESNIIQMTF